MGIDALGRLIKLSPLIAEQHQLAVIDCLEVRMFILHALRVETNDVFCIANLCLFFYFFIIIVCSFPFGFVWIRKESERKDSKERLLKERKVKGK